MSRAEPPPPPEATPAAGATAAVPVEAESTFSERFPRNKLLEGATLGLGAVIGGVVTVPPLGLLVASSFEGAKFHDIDLGPLSEFPSGKFVITTFVEDPKQGEVSRRTAYIRYNGLLQNEPNFEPENYPGMRLNAKARAQVIGNHLGPRFARAGLRTLIWDWDHNWDHPQQPLDVLADTTARRYIQGIAWHCYAGDIAAQSTVHDAYPDKDAYFSECSGGEWSPKFAENLKWFVSTLIIGATRNWARGVLLWNLALDEKHGPHLGGCGNCRGVVTIDSATGAYARNVEYYALAHASKFVRPGAQRIASAGSEQSLPSVAFRNGDDNSKILIVLNSADHDQAFSVRLAAGSFSYQLPAASVVTFEWK